MHAGIHPREIGLETPPGVGLKTPTPHVGLETLPSPQCGPRDPHSQTPHLLPWVWAWKPARHAGIPPSPRDLLQGMLGYHMQCMLGYPLNRITDTCNVVIIFFTCFVDTVKDDKDALHLTDTTSKYPFFNKFLDP